MPVTVVEERDEGEDAPRLRLVAPEDAANERQQPIHPETAEPPPKPVKPTRTKDELDEVAYVWGEVAKVLSLRALLFIAFVTVAALWGGAVWHPTMLRIVAASVATCLGFLPVTALVYRKA